MNIHMGKNASSRPDRQAKKKADCTLHQNTEPGLYLQSTKDMASCPADKNPAAAML
jgi:hypothetical protein